MLYNKFRPASWQDVVGQETTVSTLKSYIESDKLPQAIMLTGIRGTGKTSIARIIANSLEIDSVDIREIDGASNNSIENIRNLNSQLRIPPMAGKRKMYIIDEVHMLSNAAFNGLLKSIEEPPKHVYFILCTTEPEKVIKTIRSRCLEFQLNTISPTDIKNTLSSICEAEEYEYDEEALYEIANRSEGSLRDSITILDGISAFNGKVTIDVVKEHLNIVSNTEFYEVVEHMFNNKPEEVLLTLDNFYRRGMDLKVYMNDLTSFIRDLSMAEIIVSAGLKNYSDDMQQKMEILQKRISKKILFLMLDECHHGHIHYDGAYNKRLFCDIWLIRMCRITNGEEISQISKKIL